MNEPEISPEPPSLTKLPVAPNASPNVAPNVASNAEVIPTAYLQTKPTISRWFASRLWLLTLVCGVISLGLFWYSRQNTGYLITIAFREGHGLKPEDRLTYRGIEIGAVEKIELNPNRDGIVVHVRLTPRARSMAAEGAKFWIVRPMLSIDAIRGLDTLLGAKYIAIDPPSVEARAQSHFVGLDSAPIISPADGSLEISLDAKSRGGLENGAPILFRGFRIGNIVQVGLAMDARTVRARCAIDPEYRDIIRNNSKFWNRSGWRLEFGLSGLKLDADTLAQMLSGGIEMATPSEPAPSVSTGHRFFLYDKPEADWLTWQPSMVHGQALSRLSSNMPQPIRIALRWQERSFGFRTNQQRSSWCLPLSDGSVLCLSEQITAPKSALADSTQIEFAGMSLSPSQFEVVKTTSETSQDSSVDKVGRFTTSEPIPVDVLRWPADRVAAKLPDTVCDVLIAHADSSSVVAIDAGRLKKTSIDWEIEEQVLVDRDYHGLPVVSADSSQVIGFVSIHKGKKRIVR